MPPFFTVIIPTHNRVNMLGEAIQSVLNQSDSDFELIVVDDHSNDNTAQYVKKINDTRIKYILNDRKNGGGGARNAGIFRARGEWVAFLDDDDLWMPEKLAVFRKEILRDNQHIGLFYTSFFICDSETLQIKSTIKPNKAGWISQDLLYKNYIASFSCVVIRTDLLHKAEGLDERFLSLQDLDLFVRIAERTQVGFIEEPLVYIRKGHPNRISTSMQKKLDGTLLFRAKHAAAIAQSRKLRHRIDSQIFVAALHTKAWKTARQTFPWTLAGLGIDLKNMGWVATDSAWAGYRHARSLSENLLGSTRNFAD
ncbi:MAG: glycosyltransferase family 2 protein [Anaerolineales bacterium]|nr:glycosyltransferase family 2 protein [Anaerolineales bacterium]